MAGAPKRSEDGIGGGIEDFDFGIPGAQGFGESGADGSDFAQDAAGHGDGRGGEWVGCVGFEVADAVED